MKRPRIHIIEYFKKKLCGNSGFSLVEMIVVLAISSIIILIIYSGHTSISTAIHSWVGVADFYENVNLAINRMDKDITNLHFNKSNRKKICFIGESNYETPYNGKFNFVTVDHNDLNMISDMGRAYRKSDIKEVGYFLEPDEEIPDLYYLMRREDHHYDDEPEEGGETNILLENVVDLRFEFKTKYGRDWSNKIDSRNVYKLPKAVKTTLVVKDYNEKEITFSFLTMVSRQR